MRAVFDTTLRGRQRVPCAPASAHHRPGEGGLLSDEAGQKRWKEENRDAIESINSFIDRHGLLADRLRLRPEDE
jgi:hypothetical protein